MDWREIVLIEQVKKRDGRLVAFERERIARAIFKACRAVGEDWHKASRLADKVVLELEENYGGRVPSVEQIQDCVEQVLMKAGCTRVAKAYVLYRQQHADIRSAFSLLNSIEVVESYLEEKDWRVRENSNMSYSLQGLNFHAASTVVAHYWLSKLYPNEVASAHREGDFHLHDLSVLGPYCVGWDLMDLLASGFGHVTGKISSKPPKHFRTALGQVTNFFYTLQGEAAGAQAFSSFDTLLAPFIRRDGLDYGQVRQALQEFVFNVNVPTRVGFQTPFTNITLDLQPPGTLAGLPAIIGGEAAGENYGEYQREMDLFNTAFCEVMAEGDALGRIFTFPIPTYNITREFDWQSPVVEGLLKMAARHGTPYFANFVNSEMRPEDARSMCCRLRLDTRELRRRGGGLFGANPLTGSVGVVTINLPRLGFLSKSEGEYFEKLDGLADLARNSLEIKRSVLEKFTEKGLYPYSRFYLREVKRGFGEYWKNHFATIGVVGMNESLLNLLGEPISSAEGRKFALKVLEHLRKRLGEYQAETGNIYNLEATPAESAAYRFAKMDKKRFPQVIVANDGAVRGRNAAPFYTNSTHLPVGHTADVFEALEHQDELQGKYTGGTVLHAFLGEPLDDWRTARELVKKIVENFRLPYFTLTPTFSVCPNHGYLAGEHEYCPKCDHEIGFVPVQVRPGKSEGGGETLQAQVRG